MSVVKPLSQLATADLARWPIWEYQGSSDDAAAVSPAAGFEQPHRKAYIARTRFELADASAWWGYCSPTDESGLDYVQPVILAPDGPVRFWYDKQPVEPEPGRACRLLRRPPGHVFPVRFVCVVPFEGRTVAGVLSRVEVPTVRR